MSGASQVNQDVQVQDLGEQGLLRRLQQFCPADLVGDDAAVMATLPGRSLVVTTDLLIDQVHFSPQTTTAADVGWRAAAANLSDLAAMGATPLGLTVGLAIPADLAVTWLEQLYQGLVACLAPWKTPIVGGDICRSPVSTIAITAFGQVVPDQAIRRSAAQPGDAILVTGVHGASRAGLELLLRPDWGLDLSQAARAELMRAHQRPRPRLDVLPLLQEIYPAGRVGGMDSSDGLADALVQICRASGVGARVGRDRLPMPPALSQTACLSPEQAQNWVLYGGEDFELVLCLPPAIAEVMVQPLGPGAAIVGEIVAGADVVLEDPDGQQPPTLLTLEQGFQHFGSVQTGLTP